MIGIERCSSIVSASPGVKSFSPNNDPTTCVAGVKWDDGQNKGTTERYQIVLNGDVGEGLVTYAVKGGTYFAAAAITGPNCYCGDVETGWSWFYYGDNAFC